MRGKKFIKYLNSSDIPCVDRIKYFYDNIIDIVANDVTSMLDNEGSKIFNFILQIQKYHLSAAQDVAIWMYDNNIKENDILKVMYEYNYISDELADIDFIRYPFDVQYRIMKDILENSELFTKFKLTLNYTNTKVFVSNYGNFIYVNYDDFNVFLDKQGEYFELDIMKDNEPIGFFIRNVDLRNYNRECKLKKLLA